MNGRSNGKPTHQSHFDGSPRRNVLRRRGRCRYAPFIIPREIDRVERGFAALGVAAFILSALAPATMATADKVEHSLCVLILHQERVELEERELSVDLALARATAAESIFALAEALWKDDLIEPLAFFSADWAFWDYSIGKLLELFVLVPVGALVLICGHTPNLFNVTAEFQKLSMLPTPREAVNLPKKYPILPARRRRSRPQWLAL